MPDISKTSQEFVPVKEIRDGVILLKDGGLQMVLLASSLNFALKSKDEQQAIILQYQNFLNSLDFSIQILIQSRKLDIKPYLETLDDRINAQKEELLKIQAQEYKDFIKKLTESIAIMSKSFFVVIPYNPPILQNPASQGIFGKAFNIFNNRSSEVADDLSNFEENKSQLEERASVVTQGLGRLGVRSIPLGTEELIELFYKIFNPEEIGKAAR